MFKQQNPTAPEGTKITTIDFGGYLRVHAAGCQDVNKDFDRYVKENNWKPYMAHWDTVDHAVHAFYSDIASDYFDPETEKEQHRQEMYDQFAGASIAPCAHAEFQRSFREEYNPDKH